MDATSQFEHGSTSLPMAELHGAGADDVHRAPRVPLMAAQVMGESSGERLPVGPAQVNREDPEVQAVLQQCADQCAEARARMVARAPFYGDLAFKMEIKPVIDSRILTAATDGTNIYVNPYFMESLYEGGEQQGREYGVFLIAHEVEHAVREHVGTGHRFKKQEEAGTLHADLLNIAADAVINDGLTHGSFGPQKKPMLMIPGGVEMDGAREETTEAIYERLVKEREQAQEQRDALEDLLQQQQGEQGDTGQGGGSGSSPSPTQESQSDSPESGSDAGSGGGNPSSSGGASEPGQPVQRLPDDQVPPEHRAANNAIQDPAGKYGATDDHMRGDSPERGGKAEEGSSFGAGQDKMAQQYPNGVRDPEGPSDGPLSEKDRTELQRKWERELAQAVEKHSGTDRGNVPGWAQARLDEVHRPHVPWQQLVQNVISSGSKGNREDYSRPGRRMAGIQSGLRRAGIRADAFIAHSRGQDFEANVIMDTSGSMMNDLSEAFGVITEAAEQHRNYKVRVITCDADVQDDVLYESRRNPVPDTYDYSGMGGSNFRPAFTELERTPVLHPNALTLVVTDGYIDVPEQHPNASNTYWVLTRDGTPPAQWGSVIRMKDGGATLE